MKKIALAILAIVALAGCSTSTPAATVTVTQQAPAVTQAPQAPSLDDQVIISLRSQGNSYINNISDAQLLDLTSQVCPILDSGMTVRSLLSSLVRDAINSGITDPEALNGMGLIVGVAVAAYCPQYTSQVQNL